MSMFNKVVKSFQWGQHQVTMETGEIATGSFTRKQHDEEFA